MMGLKHQLIKGKRKSSSIIGTMMEPSPYMVVTDIQASQTNRDQHHGAAEHALQVISDLLENADAFLDDIESDDMLGSAIVRRCQELADLIGGLAGELEHKSEDERRALAQACIEDASANNHELAQMSQHQVLEALTGVKGLLRDVEATLRSLERREADEIADVALTIARLFILSLKQVHSTLTPEHLMTPEILAQKSRDLDFSNRIKLLDDYDEEEKKTEHTAPKTSKPRLDRMRPLWPPLGPAVVSAAEWGKEQAVQKPLLAVALGLTLWPAAVLTAVLGTPVLVADAAVQHVYQSMSDGPLVATLERTTAHAYHAARLSWLCSGLVVRQSLRVAQRQVDRHGGVQHLVKDVAGFWKDRLTHPVETLGHLWGGLVFGATKVQEGVHFVQETWEREQEKAAAAEISSSG
jgi:hypothetical protein